jgi:hypothetical protein
MSSTKSQCKKYEIHDNGGRPFFVEICGKTVNVSKNMSTYKMVNGKFVNIVNPPKSLFNVKADEVFIGKKSPKGDYDGLKPSQAEGNSILLRIGNKYMYIGHEIYEFSPVKDDVIVKYYSNIGNSDVPYPYAIGKSHIYIMLDAVAVDISYFDMKEHIYEQYYYEDRIHMCLVGNPKSNMCKDSDVYKSRIAELKEKTVKLKKKVIQKRNF